MSHVPDLTAVGRGWIAIGWLHPDHPFPEGEVPSEFSERLTEFCRLCFESVLALDSGVSCGVHTCEFCEKAWGTGTCVVLDGERGFYVPEMIAHYVEKHRYAPPAEFIAAVMACPLPGTPEYTAAAAPFASRRSSNS